MTDDVYTADGEGSLQPPVRRRIVVLAVVLALIAGGVVALRAGTTGTVADTDPAPTTASTTVRVPVLTSYRPVEEVSLGSGRPIGVSADGTAAIVVDRDPESTAQGCWGVPAEFLFAVPLDGGTRRRIGPGEEPVSMGDEIRLLRSPDGSRVATVSSCDDEGLRVFVASEGAGGVWTDFTPVDRELIKDLNSGLSWSRDGRDLLGVGGKGAVRIDVRTGTRTTIGTVPQPNQIVEMADGTLAIGTLMGGVQLGSQVLGLHGGISPSPDRRQVAVYREKVHLVAPGQTPRVLLDQPVQDVSWGPDGGALSYLTLTRFPTGTISVVLTDGTVTEVATGATTAGSFTPDGRALVFPRFVGTPDHLEVALVRLG